MKIILEFCASRRHCSAWVCLLIGATLSKIIRQSKKYSTLQTICIYKWAIIFYLITLKSFARQICAVWGCLALLENFVAESVDKHHFVSECQIISALTCRLITQEAPINETKYWEIEANYATGLRLLPLRLESRPWETHVNMLHAEGRQARERRNLVCSFILGFWLFMACLVCSPRAGALCSHGTWAEFLLCCCEKIFPLHGPGVLPLLFFHGLRLLLLLLFKISCQVCYAGCIFEPRALEVKKESWHWEKNTQGEPPHGVSRENNVSNKSAFSHNNQRAHTLFLFLLLWKNFRPWGLKRQSWDCV